MADALFNYLAPERAIIDQLKEAVPLVNGNVFRAADVAMVKETSQVTPALHVVYAGDVVLPAPAGRTTKGDAMTVDQQYYVIVVTKSAHETRTVAGARDWAGEITLSVLDALLGYEFMPGVFGPLKRVPGAAPTYTAGFAYVPFLFTTRLTLVSDNQNSALL
jgi:hypothetical protein